MPGSPRAASPAAAAPSPFRARVLAAVGAGAFGQAVSVGTQLLSLPAFLKVWSPDQYGVWVMLSAIPGYLSMADVGLVTAVGNQMTMALAGGRRDEADSLFQSAVAFVSTVCAGVVAVSLLVIALYPAAWLASADRRWALAALAGSTALTLASGLADALFRSTGRLATGMFYANLIRIGEWLGWMAGLFAFGNFAAVAGGGLLARAVGTGLVIAASARGDHGLGWSLRLASAARVRQMLRPALAFMLFPAANALNFQGVTLLVGHFFGPAAVALFNTYRTLSRSAVQLTAVVSHSLWAELARIYGAGGARAVAPIYRRSALICGAIALGLSLVLLLLAPVLLRWWTHGAIAFEPALMALMLAYAATAGLWHVPRVMLMATNQHGRLAWYALGAAALALAGVAGAGAIGRLDGVGQVLLATELLIAGLCAYLVHQAFRNAPPVAAAELP